MSVLVIQNITREGPGLIGRVLSENGISYETVDLSMGQEFPDPTAYDALVVMGGPASANDRTPVMLDEIAHVRKALDKGISYLGICLGMQVLAKASGSSIVRSRVQEVGWRGPDGSAFEIELTAAGESDPIFSGVERKLGVFQLHAEAVEPSSSMKLLARGRFCENQAIRVGENAYGFQCHLDLTADMLDVWVREDADLLKLQKTTLESDYLKLRPAYEKAGMRIFSNFFGIAGLL